MVAILNWRCSSGSIIRLILKYPFPDLSFFAIGASWRAVGGPGNVCTYICIYHCLPGGSNTAIVTNGLEPNRGLATKGLTTDLRPGTPFPTSLEQPVLVSANTPSFANMAQWQKIASSSRIYTPNGSMVSPLPGDLVDLGSGSTLGFDETSLQGKITPVAGREMGRKLDSMYNGGQVSTAAICTSLSVSIHSVMFPVRTLGMEMGERKISAHVCCPPEALPPSSRDSPRARPPYSAEGISLQNWIAASNSKRSSLRPLVPPSLPLPISSCWDLHGVTEWMRKERYSGSTRVMGGESG